MFDNLFGIGSLSDLSILAAITTIAVQFLKQIVPKKFPTKILTLIVGVVITIIFVLINVGFSAATLFSAILMGLVTAFISMNGFDALKDIWSRVSSEQERGDS